MQSYPMPTPTTTSEHRGALRQRPGERRPTPRRRALMEFRATTPGPALLFCPGDRPDRFERALATGADQVILDLEDGVAWDHKSSARSAVVAFLRDCDRQRIVVRVNRAQGDEAERDLRALLPSPPGALMLPKVERADEVRSVVQTFGDDCPPLYVTIESAGGALRALELVEAAEQVAAVTWGPYDLAADIGAPGPRAADGSLLETYRVVRSLVLLAAAARGIPAIDTATVEMGDKSILARDLSAAASLGFAAKLAIHPSQVKPIHDAFRPSPEEVSRARRLLTAAGEQSGAGAFVFEESMVDRPMLLHAERVVAREARLATSDPNHTVTTVG